MQSLKGISFYGEIDTPISDIKYLHEIDLKYDDCTLELNNVYYDRCNDFAVYMVNHSELHIDSSIVSCDFVFSFDACELYKLTDTIFICLEPILSGDDARNPIELFNKFITHIISDAVILDELHTNYGIINEGALFDSSVVDKLHSLECILRDGLGYSCNLDIRRCYYTLIDRPDDIYYISRDTFIVLIESSNLLKTLFSGKPLVKIIETYKGLFN